MRSMIARLNATACVLRTGFWSKAQKIQRLRRPSGKIMIGLVTGILCMGGQPNGTAASSGDVLINIPGLNARQQKSLAEFIRQNQQPTGDLKVLADRSRIGVRVSTVLQELFPRYSFVVVPWVYRVEPGNPHMYSIPGDGAVFNMVALSDDGARRFVFHSSGNREEYANFLREQRIKVTDATVDRLWMAHVQIYGVEDLDPSDTGNQSGAWVIRNIHFERFLHLKKFARLITTGS